MKIYALIIGIVIGGNLSGQTSMNTPCVNQIDTLESQIVHSRVCGKEIVDTLKTYDFKGRLTGWQYFGSESSPNDLIESWTSLFKGPLRISTGKFNRTGQKVGVWKYYHKKGYLWDEEEFENGKRIKRTRYKSNGEIAFEN